MNIDTQIQELAKTALDVKLSPEASLRMQEAVGKELRGLESAAPRPVMTMDEVADYLRVTSKTLEDYLGDIPSFELGGKLLFRKDSVDEWTRKREKKLAYEILEFDVKHELAL